MIADGDVVSVGKRNYAVFLLDADDCEAVAATLPSSDGWVTDLLKAAARIRAIEEDA